MKAPQSNASQVTTTNNNNARACFNCRETGHYIAHCPYAKNKPAASAFSNSVNGPRPPMFGANRVPVGSNNKGNNNSQQPYGRARVNHINVLEAQGAQGVVLGEFLIHLEQLCHGSDYLGKSQYTYSTTKNTPINPDTWR